MTITAKKNKEECDSQSYMKKFKVKRAKMTIHNEQSMENNS